MSNQVYFIYEVYTDEVTYVVSSITELESVSCVDVSKPPFLFDGVSIDDINSIKLIAHCTANDFRGLNNEN